MDLLRSRAAVCSGTSVACCSCMWVDGLMEAPAPKGAERSRGSSALLACRHNLYFLRYVSARSKYLMLEAECGGLHNCGWMKLSATSQSTWRRGSFAVFMLVMALKDVRCCFGCLGGRVVGFQVREDDWIVVMVRASAQFDHGLLWMGMHVLDAVACLVVA